MKHHPEQDVMKQEDNAYGDTDKEHVYYQAEGKRNLLLFSLKDFQKIDHHTD
jgi:hypothetical protein